MNDKVKRLLEGQGGNYIFPFFWQHGEDEKTLREYMKVIAESSIQAVCVESRPHPDYCGPKWWQDMDVILDEARKRSMKIWILDDSHFPTGYANGAMKEQPDCLCRQSICLRTYDCAKGEELIIPKEELLHPEPFQPTEIEKMIGEKEPRQFEDDRRLGIYALRIEDGKIAMDQEGAGIELSSHIKNETFRWLVPEGTWKVYVLHLSRNKGYHRSYINMMSSPSCKILLEAVYEPHYARYKEDFGSTIAGFFSDEPELGNGHQYESGNVFGNSGDYPWSDELEAELKKSLGADYARQLILLWEQNAQDDQTARIRYAYMNAVTRLVRQDFSQQMGSWCREHGVQYIGHVIEDNNQHARTGSSLGHFYRGMFGQDMAGIDDIGGQVFPQGEDIDYNNGPFATRTGEFYHYMLGKLGSSAAAIEPHKEGNSMCEIFGAYGWCEGVRLEKYLIDHFAVRGINHFVPHAFSAKEFPDPDCPPHFYAHGNNPQYRHFGRLMAYTNRVCELISGGRHIAPAAVIYHGEAEWSGDCMFSHKIGHVLCDAQIEYDYVPQDVFSDRAIYHTAIEPGILQINTQEYRAVMVPYMQYVTSAFAAAVGEMAASGIKVYFINGYPEGICDLQPGDSSETQKILLEAAKKAPLLTIDKAAETLKEEQIADISITPENIRIRYYHYKHEDGSAAYLFVNEGTEIYRGVVRIKDDGIAYYYNAWENCLESADICNHKLHLIIEPLKSKILILDTAVSAFEDASSYMKENLYAMIYEDKEVEVKTIAFQNLWKRSICRSIEYPVFQLQKQIVLPDTLAEEEPEFSGFVRYENTFVAKPGNQYILEITDAHEGVEVYVNKKSQGIQIVPPYRYNLNQDVKMGENKLVIEAATTLDREMAKLPGMFGQKIVPSALSGITGEVKLYAL